MRLDNKCHFKKQCTNKYLHILFYFEICHPTALAHTLMTTRESQLTCNPNEKSTPTAGALKELKKLFGANIGTESPFVETSKEDSTLAVDKTGAEVDAGTVAAGESKAADDDDDGGLSLFSIVVTSGWPSDAAECDIGVGPLGCPPLDCGICCGGGSGG